MTIIDFERKGNVIRFYLGEKTEEWGWTNPDYKDSNEKTPEWLKSSDYYWGDDWDDFPYDCNAGRVYDHFIKGHKDVIADFDDVVLEPVDLDYVCSKDDMVNRDVPCIIVIPKKVLEENNLEEWQLYGLQKIMKLKGIKCYYFGDEI